MGKIDTELVQDMVSVFYGEADAVEREALHAACESDPAVAAANRTCAENLSRLRNAPVDDVDARILERLERNILTATVVADAHTPRVQASTRWWHGLRDVFATPQRIGFTLAGGLAFVFIGMLIGTNVQMMPGGASAGGAVLPEGEGPSAAAVASNPQIRDFLRRSQIYLATSVDEEVACDKCPPIRAQLPNRQIAKQLLLEATALRARADGNPEVQKLITDIEFVLESIGNNKDINPVQAEMVHHIASNAVCEVTARIDTAAHRQSPR
ncbi:MAG: hypothetical protein ACKOAG_03755 [Candidatus Kapaibacterium sp.]